jgi:hypothetical protein
MRESGKPYVPELGQALFGCPTSEFAAPDEWADLLYSLGELVEASGADYNPAANTGEVFENGTFKMRAYWWGDENAPESEEPNFLHKPSGLEVRWYKWAGRGTSTNNPEADMPAVVKECAASLAGLGHA